MPLRRRRHRKTSPMKRLILPLLLAAFFAALPASAAPTKELIGEQSGSGEIFDVLEPVWLILRNVEADCTDAWVDWQQDSTKVRIYLTHTSNLSSVFGDLSGAGWYAKLPINHAGKAYYTYTTVSGGTPTPYGYNNDGNPTYSYTINENTTSADALGNARYPMIFNWCKSEAGADLDNEWKGYNYDHDKTPGQKVQLFGPSSISDPPVKPTGGSLVVQGYRGLLRSEKLPAGVGTIWFKARMSMSDSGQGLLKVARMTTTGTGRTKKWFPVDLASVRVPPAVEQNQWQQFRIVIQDPSPTNSADQAHYLIYNDTWYPDCNHYLTNSIDVCDIVLTPPFPEVRVKKDNVDYAPSFPSVLDPIDFRIEVEDVFPSVPAQFITPRLVWRQGGDTERWHEQVMTNVSGRAFNGKPGTYAYSLTKADELTDGPFEYFYEVGFTGYTPIFPAIKDYEDEGQVLNHVTNFRYGRNEYPYLIDTESLSFLTVVTNQPSRPGDAVGLISECRSPAIYPDFERQLKQDFLYPFEPGVPFSGYADYGWGTCVAPDTDATNSLWGVAHRFDPRRLVSTNGYESADGGTINLWHAPRAETWNMVLTDDGTLAYPVPGQVQIEEQFKFLGFLSSDGVRRFRSLYTDLAAATEDHPDAEKPSLLDPAYPMQHVGDYTWQAIIHITNRIDSIFSVTGACPTAAGMAEDRPVFWMQVDQSETDINPPMSGEVSVDRETGATNHNELVRFDTRADEVIVRKIENKSATTVTNGPFVTFEPGTLVGIVTNAPWCYVNEGGYPTVVEREQWTEEPGDGDVEFWFGRVVTTIESFETNGIPYDITNSVVVEDISTNVWDNGDGTWTEFRKRSFSDWIGHPERVEVTNSAPVTFALRLDTVTTTWKETNWVTNLVYRAKTEGTPYANSALGTRVDIDYDGFLMFRFCTTNGSYQIRRAAWQDFNEWQADNDYYDRSFGLYDMQTWTTDLEGQKTTPFAKNFTTLTIEDMPVGDDWADDDGMSVSGLIMKNGKVVQDRGRPNGRTVEKTDQTRNKAILLDAYPQHRGSVTTTASSSNREEEDGVVVGGGRDTLKMRVRSFTDDARTITYLGEDDEANNWENYRVAARIMAPTAKDVSPGEHSLSLVGYYKNAQNYWEARIIQKSEFTGQETTPVRNWFEVHVYNWVRGRATEVYGGVSRSGDGNRYRGDGNSWNRPYSYLSDESRKATWPVWNNNGNTGASNEKGYSAGQADYGLFTSTYEGGWTFVFDLKTDGTAVKPIVWAYRNNDITASRTAGNYYKYDCSDDPNCGIAGTALKGRPGWNTRDCGLNLGVYLFRNTDDEPEPVKFTGSTGASISARYLRMSQSEAAAEWDHNEFLDSNQPELDVWEWKHGATDVSKTPAQIRRLAPKVWYNVQVYRTGDEANADTLAPVPAEVDGHMTAWDDEWDGYHRHASDGPQLCQSWDWTDVSFPMAFWDDVFIRVRTLDEKDGQYAMAKLVVDGMECSGWRGKTVVDGDWRSYYAVIADDPATQNGRRYELNRSRANPTEKASQPQSIVSPYLENGIGGILFNYRVDDYPVRIDVQMGSGSTWKSAPGYPRELPVTDPSEKPTLYVSFLEPGTSGRIRIVALDKVDDDDPSYDARATGELGTLFVDNIRVTDYPRSGDSSWEVYNALVSNFSENRKIKFDGMSDAASTMRSVVLNDAPGPGADTVIDQPLPDHAPFIQTPSIETGVGEISFWYRASPDNGDDPEPAKITLLVAESASVPDEEWVALKPENLNTNWTLDAETGLPVYENRNLESERAAMAGLTNIVTSDWTYFSAEFYKGEYHVLRIVSGDGRTIPDGSKPNRVMVDNVLITEPVRSSIDVGTIEFLPGVPTTTRPTGARVTLVNPRLNPEIMHVYLDWYVAPGSLTDHVITTVDVDVEEKTTTEYAVITNFPTDGVNTRVSYPVRVVETTVTTNDDPTVVSASLLDPASRPWGFEAWGRRPTGTIELTNSATLGEHYTYYTSKDIPTDDPSIFSPDTVMQYAVRVEYRGQFAEPVNSATQARTKNGFWFENPSWYEPIDLNVAFGTESHPVAHVFVLSCSTNVVWINEFRPRLGVNNVNHQNEQFIEIMGPEGAEIGGWRLEHWWSLLNNRVDPSWINYTNILKDSAVFVGVNNATTNKGWGTYILGCSAFADLDGTDGFERLFPQAAETNPGTAVEPSHPFINNYGAMRLRRRMGAYVDRIAWGTASQAKTMTDSGFGYAKYISSVTLESRAGSVLFRDVDSTGEALDWIARTGYGYETAGGYNSRAQEDFLPSLDDLEEEKKLSLIDQPIFLGFEFDEDDPGYVILTFQVAVTNDVALDTKDTAYNWTVEHRGDLRAGFGDWNEFTKNQTEWLDEPNDVPANGTKDVRVRVPADPGNSGKGVRFFRIKATKD